MSTTPNRGIVKFFKLLRPRSISFSAPSYDTIWWFFARVKPHAFKELISRWLSKLPEDLKDQLLVIDGKRLRGVSDNEHISHIVELFASEGRLVIAQEMVPDKAGEVQALPALFWTQRYELRDSRTVLRGAKGEVPLVYSPYALHYGCHF